MKTSVKRAKSTTLSKKCNPNRGPTKHRKDLSIEKGISGTEKQFINMILPFNRTFGTEQIFRQPPVSTFYGGNSPFRCLVGQRLGLHILPKVPNLRVLGEYSYSSADIVNNIMWYVESDSRKFGDRP